MLASRTHRRTRNLRLMAFAKLSRALPTLDMGQCSLSRIRRSFRHIVADPRVIIANEGEGAGSTMIWVNAIDGTIIKTEKELPRRRSPEGQ
ncbi:MAG TPA: hypothetical protein VF088_00295 [Pyrinomonadaceae bacterium]